MKCVIEKVDREMNLFATFVGMMMLIYLETSYVW